MSNEIQLISDGDGLAVIGHSTDVDRFLLSEGLTSSKDLHLPRLGNVLSAGGVAAQAGAGIAENSGRWVQLTKESAEAVKKYGLMKNKTTGLDMGVVFEKGQPHGIKSIVQFVKGPGANLANPALLAGAAGIMAQYAMQQTMNEILDYLVVIDEKVDDILRAQKNAALADMIGAELIIDETMSIREETGRVTEVMWSKVQNAPGIIATVQTYALLQLDSLAEKFEKKTSVKDAAKIAKEIEPKVAEWLAVLARCFELQDAIAVLELDRVFDASPDDLDAHRRGLRAARRKRRELIAQSTVRLMARMDATAARANSQVLLHPVAPRAVVAASNEVAASVVDFHGRLGIEQEREVITKKPWVEAVTDARDDVIEKGEEGVVAVKRFGDETTGRARRAVGEFAAKVAEKALAPEGKSDEVSPED